MNDKLTEDLDGIIDALDVEELSPEEKEQILNEAQENFDKIEGVDFDDLSKEKDKSVKIEKDYETAKKVLQNNISRTEKLTKLIFNNIALDSTDVNMISTGVQIVTTQNQNLKLLTELHNKTLQNLKAQKTLDDEDDPDRENGKKKKSPPPGFSK